MKTLGSFHIPGNSHCGPNEVRKVLPKEEVKNRPKIKLEIGRKPNRSTSIVSPGSIFSIRNSTSLSNSIQKAT